MATYTPLPAIPVPGSETFNQDGGVLLDALPLFGTELKAMADEVLSVNTASATSATASASSATASAASAAASAISATASASSANFKGNWSALTGALNVPASVLHNGQIWQLTANLANVTTATPGVSASWYPVVNIDVASRAPIQPTLDLDFANQRYRVFDGAVGLKGIALADILTYTGSGRTHTDAQGILRAQSSNVPRLAFDPVTGVGNGLSVWGARTNLLTYSQAFDNAFWGKTGCTVSANAVTAPDGTVTAGQLVVSAVNENHYISTGIAGIAASTVCTLSVIAKARDTSRLLIQCGTSGYWLTSVEAVFDLITGTVASGTGTITALGNGFYRCSISVSTDITTTARSFLIGIANTSNVILYTGNGTSGIYLWGAQLEVGTAASPYIPTVAATVTAPADVASITGSNFSKWFNQTEGTFVVLLTQNPIYGAAETGSKVLLGVGDPTKTFGVDSELLYISRRSADNKIDLVVIDGGVNQTANVNNSPPTNIIKAACSYKLDSFSLSINASSVVTDSSGSVPSVTQLVIGDSYGLWAGGTSGLSAINGTVQRILYFPRALPAYLQALSA